LDCLLVGYVMLYRSVPILSRPVVLIRFRSRRAIHVPGAVL